MKKDQEVAVFSVY